MRNTTAGAAHNASEKPLTAHMCLKEAENSTNISNDSAKCGLSEQGNATS